MALSRRNASDSAWMLCLQYLEANGFQILECLPYGPVHNVHERNSWHYDWFLSRGKRRSRGADVNWPGGGTTEHSRIVAKVPAIRSFGVAIIFNATGSGNGPTKAHSNHAHLDQGSYSNLGSGQVAIMKSDLTVYVTQGLLHVHIAAKDNLNGKDTMHRLGLVRAASGKGGGKFPSGIKATQQVIGAALTGKWDAQSRKAHDATVKGLKAHFKTSGLFKGTVNTIWDSALDDAVTRFNNKY